MGGKGEGLPLRGKQLGGGALPQTKKKSLQEKSKDPLDARGGPTDPQGKAASQPIEKRARKSRSTHPGGRSHGQGAVYCKKEENPRGLKPLQADCLNPPKACKERKGRPQ